VDASCGGGLLWLGTSLLFMNASSRLRADGVKGTMIAGNLGSQDMTVTWLVRITPMKISYEVRPFWKGSHNPILRELRITTVLNHLLNGMILQVVGFLKVTTLHETNIYSI